MDVKNLFQLSLIFELRLLWSIMNIFQCKVCILFRDAFNPQSIPQ